MNTKSSWFQSLISHKYFPFLLLLILNLVIGALVVTNYGESQDEHIRLRYANKSISAYLGIDKKLGDEKGPFYVMTALLGSRVLNAINKNWLPIDAWHFMHFLSFQLGLFFLYRISLRFANKWAAFGGVLLFNTQPLLWGHAFINPKDIPFMSFFLASMDLGIEMVDSLVPPTPESAKDNVKTTSRAISLETVKSKLAEDWRLASLRKKALLIGSSVLAIGLLIVLTVGSAPVLNLIAQVVEQAYTTQTGILGLIFSLMAENAQGVPLELYVNKSLSLYTYFVYIYGVATLIWDLLAIRILFSSTTEWLWQGYGRPLARLIGLNLKNKKVILAALFLGLTASIRVAGPMAGLLIGVYWLAKSGRKAIPALIAYFGIAFLVFYITWPGMWSAPLQGYSNNISKALDFPWEGKVMFAGTDYAVTELPRSFLPVMLSLQFTETAMLMFLAGLLVALFKSIRNTLEWKKVALIAIWLVAPVMAIVIIHPKIYDNFRHFLFIIPPIFIFAAIGFQGLFERIKNPLLSFILVAVLIAPNIYWGYKLHPYQYVYYNSLAGNVGGAFRRYEMDYWGTTYREAAEYLNRVAPPDSTIIVWGADHLVKTFARPDLKIEDYQKVGGVIKSPDASSRLFAIVSTRHNKDLEVFPTAKQLFLIERSGAILAVIKELTPSDTSNPQQ